MRISLLPLSPVYAYGLKVKPVKGLQGLIFWNFLCYGCVLSPDRLIIFRSIVQQPLNFGAALLERLIWARSLDRWKRGTSEAQGNTSISPGAEQPGVDRLDGASWPDWNRNELATL